MSSFDITIEEQLNERLCALEECFHSDVIAVAGPIHYGMDDLIRDAVEDRFGNRKARKPKFTVVLETTGGYIEVAQRIVETFRRHYRQVEFVVPNYAMSAGTVLVLSGDAIHMDYYSVLGPIDPQVQRQGGMVPALGYLEQYKRLVEKSSNGDLSTAELAFLVQRFDPAELYSYEQARDLSITLLKEWLVKYKFKDWKQTRTRRLKVTPKMKRDRAEQIAAILNKTDEWHSHGRGISMDVLRKRVGLEIDDFGAKPELSKKIRTYYRLLSDYIMSRRQTGVVHTCGRYVPIF